MYSSATPLKNLTLKVGRGAYLYHQIMAYNDIIAYGRLAFVVIKLKEMFNYIAARELRHEKRYFNIMSSTIHTIGSAIL